MKSPEELFEYTLSDPHPFHTVNYWQEEVRDLNTRLGYSEWVRHQLEPKVMDYYQELIEWARDPAQLRGVLRIMLGNMDEDAIERLMREDPAMKFLRAECKYPEKFSTY